jgi:hypothetical protein
MDPTNTQHACRQPGTYGDQRDTLFALRAVTSTLAGEIASLAVKEHAKHERYVEAEANFGEMEAKVWGLLQNCCGRLDVAMNEDSFDRSANALVESVNTAARHQHEYRLLLHDLNLYEVKDFDAVRTRVREMRQFMDTKPTLDRRIASLEGDLRMERERADNLQADVARLTAELAKCKEAPAEVAAPSPAPASNAFGGWVPTPEGEPFQVALRVMGSLVEMQVLEQPKEWTGIEDIRNASLALYRAMTPSLNPHAVFLRGKNAEQDRIICQWPLPTPDHAIAYAAEVRDLIARANAEWKAKKQAEAGAKTGGGA